MMWQETCLIEARCGAKDEKVSSCCGIVIQPKLKFVVTHSTLLLPFLPSGKEDTHERDVDQTIAHAVKDIGISVTFQRKTTENQGKPVTKTSSQLLPKVSWPNIHGQTTTGRNSGAKKMKTCSASLVTIWKAEHFAKTLERLMPKSEGWQLTDPGKYIVSITAELATSQIMKSYHGFLLVKLCLG